ncbi:phage regulatory protein/antirepressor Ant [uncultured Psychrobacter sp.]|uniref:phage regulatory protein/antirepressor Ant n=1 Tax=uncultured Psychrobacter sp. TaxID=259303 RepID=UPI002619896E|nr:phage regulatory protein/antirepressor Ant [uncultured Psychrobacter sp.]
MNIQTLQTNNNQTMSSREIAGLCNKDHRHVLRDIDDLNATYEVMALPKVGQSNYTADNGQSYRQYLLNKEQTIDLITGYRADIRIRINRRWQELEAQASAPVIPATLSEALRLAADQAELIEHQQSRLALVEPKAAALDVIDSSIGSINVRDTAKTLGIPQNKFVNWCIAHDWMYRDNRNKLKMSSIRMKQGFMEERTVTYQGNSNERVATTQPLFTPKGLTRLAYVFAIVHEVA